MRLPDGDGIAVCREIRSAHDEIACLILTSFSDDEALVQAIVAGASGYLLKQIRGNDIVDAVRRVARGESLLDPAVAERVAERLRRPPAEDERLARLTGQERKILALIADGLTNRQIADELHLAEKTVKNYVSNLWPSSAWNDAPRRRCSRPASTPSPGRHSGPTAEPPGPDPATRRRTSSSRRRPTT